MDEQDYDKLRRGPVGGPYIRDMRTAVQRLHREAVKPEKKLKTGTKPKQFKPYSINDILNKIIEVVVCQVNLEDTITSPKKS